MAPSFDYAASSLLCAEDNGSIFDGDVDECETGTWNQGSILSEEQRCNGWEGSSGLLPKQSEECLGLMFEKECQYLPGFDYLHRLWNGDLDFAARTDAIHWILKVQSHYNFGPLCTYLAVNYLNRFLSAYDLPRGKAWMMQLLAVACVSIAAKMEETEVPLSLDLQVAESKYTFEAKTIQRMELLVMSTLKWRMQSITPFSFLDYFLCKLNGDQMPSRSLIFQSIQLVLNTLKGIEFLEFKPSEIAAAVAITVTGESQIVEPDNAISFLSEHVQKARLFKCIEMIQNLSLTTVKGGSGAALSVPQSPIGVLDAAACLSYSKSDVSPAGSCVNSTHNSPAPKRRKLNKACEEEEH